MDGASAGRFFLSPSLGSIASMALVVCMAFGLTLAWREWVTHCVCTICNFDNIWIAIQCRIQRDGVDAEHPRWKFEYAHLFSKFLFFFISIFKFLAFLILMLKRICLDTALLRYGFNVMNSMVCWKLKCDKSLNFFFKLAIINIQMHYVTQSTGHKYRQIPNGAKSQTNSIDRIERKRFTE